MFWNVNELLNDQHLLSEFLAEYRIDIALFNLPRNGAYRPVQCVEQKNVYHLMEEQP
jgi:hypothetical protein